MSNFNYINSYSWKCLLGKQSKEIVELGGIYFWNVGNRKHFCVDRDLEDFEISGLVGYNFHYLSEKNCNLLKTKYKVSRSKELATYIDLTQLSIAGDKHKSLRHAINRGKKYNLVQEENYRDIKDVKKMLNEWSDVLAQKYFRDNSGKNEYFFAKNYHLSCHNVFLYDGADLVAFGAANPEKDGYSSYVLGKTLCNRYYGLSEYTDYLLYLKCLENGIKIIDLGQTTGGMIFYKGKFPGAGTYNFYNGKVEYEI